MGGFYLAKKVKLGLLVLCDQLGLISPSREFRVMGYQWVALSASGYLVPGVTVALWWIAQ